MKRPKFVTHGTDVGSRNLPEILFRGASIALLIHIAGNAVGYIVQILLARWVGVIDFGNYTYLVTWAQVVAIGACLGLDFGLVRFIAEYSELRDWEHLRGVLGWSRRLVLGSGMALAAASALILLIVHPIHTSTIAMVLASLLIPLVVIMEIQTQILRGARRIAWAYGPSILFTPLLFLAAAFFLLQVLGKLSDRDSLAAMILSLCVIVVVQILVIKKIFSGLTRDVSATYDTKRWLGVSIPLLFNSIFIVLLLRVDTLAVGFLRGSEEVGVYGAAVKTATIAGFALYAANTIVGPIIASHYARKDMAGLQEVISLTTLGSFTATLLIGLGVILFSGPILGAFGEAFLRARIPLFILIAGQLVSVGSGSVGLLMFLTGLERQSMKVLACCVLIIGALCILIIPRFGIVGAAAASALGLSLWNIWSYRLVVKNLGIHPSIFYACKKLFWLKE